MTEKTSRMKLPPTPTLVSGLLVALGVGLWMTVGKELLWVAGLGAFGPGLLRELGWLNDQDEFQRETAYRAGYRSYLVGGMAAVLSVSALHWGLANPGETAEWVTLVLVYLWLAWLFSSLLAYWGARRTAQGVLTAVGSFWALFVILEIASEFQIPQSPAEVGATLTGLLFGAVLIGFFFGLGWAAQQWPRPAGVLLVLAATLFAYLFARPQGNLTASAQLLTATLLVVPFAATGIALLKESETSAADESSGGGKPKRKKAASG